MRFIRRAGDRGFADHGWLKSRHTFSFADYVDPDFMGFRVLRVINEDRVAAGQGFPTHPHRDMEILSYVLDGALEHKDSMGTGSVIRPGDVQRMTAGTGVTHSEYNHSKTEGVHFLQIWIPPNRRGLTPSYEQKSFPEAERRGRFRVIASPDGRDGSVTVHQDASLHSALVTAGETATYETAPGRHVWLQVARGRATLDGEELAQGDGVAIAPDGGEALVLRLGTPDPVAEILLFDMP